MIINKRLFCILIVLASPCIIAQERQISQTTFPKKTIYKAPLLSTTSQQKEPPFFLVIENRLGLLGSTGPYSFLRTLSTSSLTVHLFFPLPKNIRLQFQFRSSFPHFGVSPPIGNSLSMLFHASTTIGFYIGISSIVWDKRVEQRGWTISMNGGIFTDFGMRNFFALDRNFITFESAHQMVAIGLEASPLFAYYFDAKGAITLSIYWSLHIAPLAGDPFFVSFRSFQVSFTQMSFGIGIGLLF